MTHTIEKLGEYNFSKEVLNHLINTYDEGQIVLELGSGVGSHLLSNWFEVHCIEHDKEYIEKYSGVKYYYAPLKNGWYNITFDIPKYDILIIDGPPGSHARGFIQKNLFNWDGTIVIDDVHRSSEMDLLLWLDRTYTLIGKTAIVHAKDLLNDNS